MKTKKKNRFLTFCFSLMPGAAEMYMGFMKSGISLMILFFLVILFATIIGQGALAVFSVVIWFYGFFHANHLASLSDEEFGEVKDEYLFGMEELPGLKSFVRKYRSWVAGAMILIGICLLWNAVTSLMYEILPQRLYFIVEVMWRIGDFVPSLVVGAGIILLGIRMLRGKEAVLADTQAESQAEAKETQQADAAAGKEQEEKK